MTTPSGNRDLDIENSGLQSPQVSVAPNDENTVGTSDGIAKPDADPSPSITTGKRQRTLFDMLGSGQGTGTTSKKPKVTAPGSGDKPNGTQNSGGSSSQQALNSIPFSLGEYIDSLTDDQKRLLTLECETMGKSW
jgi:uracil-DNA glycosylase